MKGPYQLFRKDLMTKSAPSLLSESHELFNNKYIHSDPKYATDLQNIRHRTMYPGRLYTYFYYPLNRNNEKVLPFYDLQPIALILSKRSMKKKRSVLYTAINLNWIPMQIRPVILGIYHKVFRQMIDREYKKIKSGKHDTITNMFFKQDFDFSKVFRKMLENAFGNKYKLAIRSYRMEMISNIHLIEYDDWYKTGFINSKQFVRTSVQEMAMRWHEEKK